MLEPAFNKVAGLHFACEDYLLTAASDFLESSFFIKHHLLTIVGILHLTLTSNINLSNV